MSHVFDDFQVHALQFASFAGYRSIDAGIVYLRGEQGPKLLDLRCIFSREAPDTTGFRFELPELLAFRFRLSIDFLERLLDQFRHGAVTWLGEELPDGPVRLYSEALSASGLTDSLWNLSEGSEHVPLSLEVGWSENVQANWRALDRAIANQSGHAFASLARLCHRVTGREIRPGLVSTSIEVPWPITSVSVDTDPRNPLLIVAGLSGLDTSRFIVNVEARQDQVLMADQLGWSMAPMEGSDDEAQYVTRLPITPRETQAINLFVRDVVAFHFRREVRVAPNINGLHRAPTNPEPVEPASQKSAFPRITQMGVENYRLLAKTSIDFETSRFNVLVGPNQSGKSTLLDALALVRGAASGKLSKAIADRGTLSRLINRQAATKQVTFTLRLADDGADYEYAFTLAPRGPVDYVVETESLRLIPPDGTPLDVLNTVVGDGAYRGRSIHARNPRELLVAQLRDPAAFPELDSVRSALSAIAVYPYFRTGAAWARAEPEGMRSATRIDPGARLHPIGLNLAAVLQRQREEHPDDWEHMLSILRIVFPDLEDIRTPAVGVGQVSLRWDDGTPEGLDASELSDGTLQLLCCLAALNQRGDSLVAIDEPERGLHPNALYRLLAAARASAEDRPVLFATQSDTLLDLLDDGPDAVVVAERREGSARFVRPDKETLQEWAREFGLSDMRRELENWGGVKPVHGDGQGHE